MYIAQGDLEDKYKTFQNNASQKQLEVNQSLLININKQEEHNKINDKDRPISFCSYSPNFFMRYQSERVQAPENIQSDLDIKQNTKNRSLEIETKPSLFATFAMSSQPQQQVPYFKQVSFQEIIEVKPSTQQEDPVVKASSYSSNFITSQLEWTKDLPIRNVESEYPIKKQYLKSIPQPQKQVIEEPQVPSFNKGKIMESQGLIQTSKNKYRQITFKITEDAFSIQNVPISIKMIAKVKIYPINQALPNYNQLKISTKGVREQLLLALKKTTKYIEFPLPYFTMAKLVIKKLKYLGVSSITEWELPQRKPTSFYMKKNINQKSSRSKTKEKKDDKRQKSKQKPIKKQNEGMKAQIKQILCQANTYVHGQIFKKSRHFGRWQKRYITINELGIFSYKDSEDENASVRIDRKSIKYIWTWFSLLIEQYCEKQDSRKFFEYQETQLLALFKKPNFLEHNKYLIIKVKHGFSDQTEFAIPIYNYDSDSKGKNWLYGFYKVLPALETG